MGWLTLDEAKANAGVSDETDASIDAVISWLKANEYYIPGLYASRMVKLYDQDGITLTQEQIDESGEFRAIDEDLAKAVSRRLKSDNTKTWRYYGITPGGNVVIVPVVGGPEEQYAGTVYYRYPPNGSWKSRTMKRPDASKVPRVVEAEARRSNSAEGWLVSVRAHEYEVISVLGTRSRNEWFTPSPMEEAQSGVEVSRSSSKTFIALDGTKNVFQNVSSSVKEYRFLSKSEADSKVDSETVSASRTIEVPVVVSWGTQGTFTKNVTVRGAGANGTTAATDKTAQSRYDESSGTYTVAVTSTTYWVSNS